MRFGLVITTPGTVPVDHFRLWNVSIPSLSQQTILYPGYLRISQLKHPWLTDFWQSRIRQKQVGKSRSKHWSELFLTDFETWTKNDFWTKCMSRLFHWRVSDPNIGRGCLMDKFPIRILVKFSHWRISDPNIGRVVLRTGFRRVVSLTDF